MGTVEWVVIIFVAGMILILILLYFAARWLYKKED